MSDPFAFMKLDNPNQGFFEKFDTYVRPPDTFVIPEIAEQRKKDKVKLRNYLYRQSLEDIIPEKHTQYLVSLKNNGFEPKVIYDIGSCLLHWSKVAKKIWPKAKIYAFEASTTVDFLYNKKFGLGVVQDYDIGVLTNTDNREVTFYQNNAAQTGNSYYKEVGGSQSDILYNRNTATTRVGMTLDSVVNKRGFPLPDLVKIDVQGAEKDVVEGGVKTLGNCQHLIVEMQSKIYNEGAPLVDETLPFIESIGFKCEAPLFCDNGPDGDYGFVRSGESK